MDLNDKIKCQSMEDEVDEFDEEEADEVTDEVVISYACEDCDYRWEITAEDEEEVYEEIQYCPMCGSANSTQI